jgi:hypothetical protein
VPLICLRRARYSRFVSKRSRRRARRQPADLPAPISRGGPPPPKADDEQAEPERLLLDQIASGELDLQLSAIAEAVRARCELLRAVNSQKALAMLNVGDRVRINHHANPKYLRGIHGVVVELDEHTATICVHRPIGRFRSGEIRCPPLLLERLSPAT